MFVVVQYNIDAIINTILYIKHNKSETNNCRVIEFVYCTNLVHTTMDKCLLEVVIIILIVY